jgi:DNA-binding MarR family transcriptional regulator
MRNARSRGHTARGATSTTESPRLNDVTSRLRLAVMRLARRLRQESAEGLTPSMLSVLASIHRAQPVTLGALAALERVQPPTITATIARLEDAGLVHRETDAGDRRVTRVRLSDAGHQLIRRTRTRKDAFLALRLRRLPAEDLATLDRAAAIVERLLEDER